LTALLMLAEFCTYQSVNHHQIMSSLAVYLPQLESMDRRMQSRLSQCQSKYGWQHSWLIVNTEMIYFWKQAVPIYWEALRPLINCF